MPTRTGTPTDTPTATVTRTSPLLLLNCPDVHNANERLVLQASFVGDEYLREPHYHVAWDVIPSGTPFLDQPDGPGSNSLTLIYSASSFTATQYHFSVTVTDTRDGSTWHADGATTINYPPVASRTPGLSVSPTASPTELDPLTIAATDTAWTDPEGDTPYEYRLVYRHHCALCTQAVEVPLPLPGHANWTRDPHFTFTVPTTPGAVTFVMYVRDARGAEADPVERTVPVRALPPGDVLAALAAYPLSDPAALTDEELALASGLLPRLPDSALHRRLQWATDVAEVVADRTEAALPRAPALKAFWLQVLSAAVTSVPTLLPDLYPAASRALHALAAVGPLPQPHLQRAIDVLEHMLRLQRLDVAGPLVALEDALLRDQPAYTCVEANTTWIYVTACRGFPERLEGRSWMQPLDGDDLGFVQLNSAFTARVVELGNVTATVDYVARSVKARSPSRGHATQSFRVFDGDGVELAVYDVGDPISFWFTVPLVYREVNVSNVECWFRGTQAQVDANYSRYLVQAEWARDFQAVADTATQVALGDPTRFLVECRATHLTEFALLPSIVVDRIAGCDDYYPVTVRCPVAGNAPLTISGAGFGAQGASVRFEGTGLLADCLDVVHGAQEPDSTLVCTSYAPLFGAADDVLPGLSAKTLRVSITTETGLYFTHPFLGMAFAKRPIIRRVTGCVTALSALHTADCFTDGRSPLTIIGHNFFGLEVSLTIAGAACDRNHQKVVDSMTIVCTAYSGEGTNQPVAITVDGVRSEDAALVSFRPRPYLTGIFGCDTSQGVRLHLTRCPEAEPGVLTFHGTAFGGPRDTVTLTIGGVPCPNPLSRTATTYVCGEVLGVGALNKVVLTVNGEPSLTNATVSFAAPCPVVNGLECAGHGTCSWSQCGCQADAAVGHWDGEACNSCRAGYWGLDCRKECPGGGADPCSGHGVCGHGRLGSGECFCVAGYVGVACGVQCPLSAGNAICSGNGICNTGGTCDCFSTGDLGYWTGPLCGACQLHFFGGRCASACPGYPDHICSGRGTCADGVTGAGTCACDAGFTGPNCDIECFAGGICSRHGSCAPDGSCLCFRSPAEGYWDGLDCSVCLIGWSGSGCDLFCPVNDEGRICAENGVCTNGRCNCMDGACGDACEVTAGCNPECAAGYWGPECDAACPGLGAFGECTGHGKCDSGRQGSGACACDDGYYGAACTGECPTAAGVHCNAPLGGRCDGALERCVCYAGYAGEACGVMCRGGASNPCNGRGVCSAGVAGDGTCACDETAWGPDCRACPGVLELQGVCHGHGTCAPETGVCACVDNDADGHWGGPSLTDCGRCIGDWFGANCDRHCPVTGPGELCSGHGACLAESEVCKCQSSSTLGYWAGETCDDCESGYWGPACARQCAGGACTPCSNHGSCSQGRNGTGECTCHGTAALGFWQGDDCTDCRPGYYGIACTAECPGGHATPCTGHGLCSNGPLGTGQCACQTAPGTWGGEDCRTCAAGYFGADCTGQCLGLGSSAGVCSSHGACSDGLTGDGKCACAPGFWDPACGSRCPLGLVGEVCDARGTCDDGAAGTGMCVCPSNAVDGYWTGVACTLCQPYHYGALCGRRCPGYNGALAPDAQTDVCSGHGTCSEGRGQSGACACNRGYAGANCGLTCPGLESGKICGLRGVCDSVMGACQCSSSSTEGFFAGRTCELCQPEYSGPACLTPCPVSAGAVCSGHGTCLEGRCFCSESWCGTMCDISDAGVCRQYYCPTYWGPTCSTPCPGLDAGVVCSGHGQCDDGRLGSGLCACDATWTTADCSRQCPGTVDVPGGDALVCSGQGSCNSGTGACQCFAGIAGPDCAIVCPADPLWGVCSAHGVCNEGAAGDGTCTCATGYMGATCGEECPGGKANPCSGHGSCDAQQRLCACDRSATSGYWGGGACEECTAGWFGNACMRPCRNGRSVARTCVCLPGYAGPGCDVECPGGAADPCYGHGTCDEGNQGTGTCACDPGYLAALQCARPCNGGALTPCSGHGTCDLATGACACVDDDARGHFAGAACEVCAPEFFPRGLCTLQCPKDDLGRNCSGHGSCLTGSHFCRCVSDAAGGYWKGDICGQCQDNYWGPECKNECPGGICRPCNGHGACDWGLAASGVCTCASSDLEGYWVGGDCSACAEGYWGSLCAQQCPGGTAPEEQCYGHGVCADGLLGTGACACDNSADRGHWDPSTDCADCLPGHWGAQCTRQCPGASGAVGSASVACSGHGACSDGRAGTGDCACTAEYINADCSQRCPGAAYDPVTRTCDLVNQCTNGVVVGAACECHTGWRGFTCDTACPGFLASGQECHGHGTCNAAAECACDFSWAGYDAAAAVVACGTRCPGIVSGQFWQQECSGHGTCAPSAECDCFRDLIRGYWDGVACDACLVEWLGPFCTLQCPKNASGYNCSGHGFCVGREASCTCDNSADTGFWTGTTCSECLAGYWGPECRNTCPGGGCVCSGKGQCADGTAGAGTCFCQYNISTGFFVGEACSRCRKGIWGENCLSACPGLTHELLVAYDLHDPRRPWVVVDNPLVDRLICHGHGVCRDGRSNSGACECDRGPATGYWAGACDDCLAGYFGPGCTSVCPPVALPGNPCHGGGVCDDGRLGNGTCYCDVAHAGVACEMQCPYVGDRLCNRVGRCSNGTFGTGLCVCPADGVQGYWRGDACEECVSGWWGPNCTTACPGGAALPCAGHGTCSDLMAGTGQCACDFGWAGPSCALECPGGADNVCSGHGTCNVLSGECQCNTPDAQGNVHPGVWGSAGRLLGREEDCSACHPLYSTAKSCTSSLCLCATPCPVNPAYPGVVCSGHGECEQGLCTRCTAVPERREYWCGEFCQDQGIFCALTLCPLPGQWGTDCAEVCPGAMPTTDGSYDNVCSVHGKCSDGRDGDGTCRCDWGYTGAACDRVCPGGLSKPCNGRGLCTALEGCACNAGWAGPACTVECNGGRDSPCTGHGTCLSGAGGTHPGSCACDFGWSGLACEQACPGGPTTPCLGHGVCGMVSGEVACDCDASLATGYWAGVECGDCQPPFHGPNCSKVCTNGVVVGQLCNCSFGFYGFGCGRLCPAFSGQGPVCSAHGQCDWGHAGTGACACGPDWYGPDCSRFCTISYCQFTRSLGKPQCSPQGTCECQDNLQGHWAGEDCDRCADGFWGADCDRGCICTVGQSTCDQFTGACRCFADPERGFFAGEACDACADGYIVPDCKQRNVAPALHRTPELDLSVQLFIDVPATGTATHQSSTVGYSTRHDDSLVIVGSDPSVVLWPDGRLVVLPVAGCVIRVFLIDDQYVFATRDGQFHRVPAPDLPKCPNCTFRTADPLRSLPPGNASAASRSPRSRRQARALSLGNGAPLLLRPRPVPRNGTCSEPWQALSCAPWQPPPAAAFRPASGAFLSQLQASPHGVVIVSESLPEWPIIAPGDRSTRPQGSARAGSAAPHWPFLGARDSAQSSAVQSSAGRPGFASEDEAAARALQWPAATPGGRKGWRTMLPAGVAAALEITACAEAQGRLFCAFSGAMERFVRALDPSTWAPSPDGLNVTGLMDVVNLLQVARASTLVLGGHKDGHWEIAVSPIDASGRLGPAATVFKTTRTEARDADCAATLCLCYSLGRNFCGEVVRMAAAGDHVYSALTGDQVVYLIKVEVVRTAGATSARVVAANSIPVPYDRQHEAPLVTAMALDASPFQIGFVCASKTALPAAADGADAGAPPAYADTPSTLYKWSMATLQVTGSARFQDVTITSPSGTIERVPEVVQALHVRPHRRMDALVYMRYTLRVIEVNLFAVVSVAPDYAEATGGTRIDVFGEGLAFSDAARCRFGAAPPSPARFIATDHVQCTAPPAPTGGPETCTGQALELDLLGTGRFTSNGVTVKRLARPTITALVPNRRFRTGGVVTLMGHSFVNTAYLKCRFGTAPERGLDDEQETAQVTFVNSSVIKCLQPPYARATEIPGYVELSLDGQIWSDSRVPFAVVGDAVAIRVEAQDAGYWTQPSAEWLTLNPINVTVVDSVLPPPQGHPLLEFDGVPRTITVAVYRGAVRLNVTGTAVLATAEGRATFRDLRLHRPTIGSYSVNFSTADLGMGPGSSSRAAATWGTGITITIVEGVAYALQVLQEPAPLTVDNAEAFSNQPILMLQDISGNFISTDMGVLVTAEFVGYAYGYQCVQGWEVTAPYYPCYDAASVYSERVISADGVYLFESLKLVGYHNMSYRVRFYVVDGTSTVAIQDAYSNEITVGGCSTWALKFKTECVACPANAICDGSITCLASPNFWRATNTSRTFYECEQTQACIGRTETGDCMPGYAPGSILCAVCAEGYALEKVGGQCAKCGSTGSNIALVILILIVVYCVLCFMVFSNMNSSYTDMFPMYTKLLLNHLQYISIISGFQFTRPDFVDSVFSVQKSAATGSVSFFNSFECLVYGESQAGRRFWFHMIFPLGAVAMLPVSVILVNLLKKSLRRCFREKMHRRSMERKFKRGFQTLQITIKRLEFIKVNVVQGQYFSMELERQADGAGPDAMETGIREKTEPTTLIWEEECHLLAPPRSPEDELEDWVVAMTLRNGDTGEADGMAPAAQAQVAIDDALVAQLLLDGPQELCVDFRTICEKDDEGYAVGPEVYVGTVVLLLTGQFPGWRGLEYNYDSDSTCLSRGKLDRLAMKYGHVVQPEGDSTSSAGTAMAQGHAMRRRGAVLLHRRPSRPTGDTGTASDGAGDAGDGDDDSTSAHSRMREVWEAFDDERSMWSVLSGPRPERLTMTEITVVGTVIILYILYPNLIERITQVLQCRDLDWGDGEVRRYLLADYRIDCDGAEYAFYRIVAFAFILVYGLGIPLGTMLAVRVYIEWRGIDAALRRWAFLTRALRESRWYWELFTMIRKLLLVFVGVFIKDPFLQVFCGTWVLVGALVLELCGAPYCDAAVDALARMSICTLLLSLSIASFFLFDLPTWAAIVVTVFLVLSLVVPLYIFLQSLFQQVLLKVIAWAMDPKDSFFFAPVKGWLRRKFLRSVDNEQQKRDLLNELGAGSDGAPEAEAHDWSTALRVLMLEPEPHDAKNLTTILNVIREIHLIAGCTLESLDVRSGTEAWVAFADAWERDEFHETHQTVTTNGKTFILLDPSDTDPLSDGSDDLRSWSDGSSFGVGEPDKAEAPRVSWSLDLGPPMKPWVEGRALPLHDTRYAAVNPLGLPGGHRWPIQLADARSRGRTGGFDNLLEAPADAEVPTLVLRADLNGVCDAPATGAPVATFDGPLQLGTLDLDVLQHQRPVSPFLDAGLSPFYGSAGRSSQVSWGARSSRSRRSSTSPMARAEANAVAEPPRAGRRTGSRRRPPVLDP